MARKKKHEEHENHERWLVSYADFITLLFAFFTTMYAVSNVDAQKMGRMVLSMQAAFESTVFPPGSRQLSLAPPSAVGGEAAMLYDSVRPLDPLKAASAGLPGKQDSITRVKAQLESMIVKHNLAGRVRLVLDRRGLIIRLAEVGFYDSGSPVMRPESLAIIDTLADQLAPLSNAIRIEGHTDNVPINTARYRSNWELSTARATNIVLYLQDRHKIDPERLSASGYGEYRPLVSNDTTENRRLNRRVDIILLSDEAAQKEPPRQAGSAGAGK